MFILGEWSHDGGLGCDAFEARVPTRELAREDVGGVEWREDRVAVAVAVVGFSIYGEWDCHPVRACPECVQMRACEAEKAVEKGGGAAATRFLPIGRSVGVSLRLLRSILTSRRARYYEQAL